VYRVTEQGLAGGKLGNRRLNPIGRARHREVEQQNQRQARRRLGNELQVPDVARDVAHTKWQERRRHMQEQQKKMKESQQRGRR